MGTCKLPWNPPPPFIGPWAELSLMLCFVLLHVQYIDRRIRRYQRVTVWKSVFFSLFSDFQDTEIATIHRLYKNCIMVKCCWGLHTFYNVDGYKAFILYYKAEIIKVKHFCLKRKICWIVIVVTAEQSNLFNDLFASQPNHYLLWQMWRNSLKVVMRHTDVKETVGQPKATQALGWCQHELRCNICRGVAEKYVMQYMHEDTKTLVR